MARDKSPPLVGSGLGPVSALVRGRSLASGSGAFPCSAHSGIRRSRAILAQHLPLRGQLRNCLFRRPDEGAPDSRFNRRVAAVTSGGAKSNVFPRLAPGEPQSLLHKLRAPTCASTLPFAPAARIARDSGGCLS